MRGRLSTHVPGAVAIVTLFAEWSVKQVPALSKNRLASEDWKKKEWEKKRVSGLGVGLDGGVVQMLSGLLCQAHVKGREKKTRPVDRG
jgi:hypothetical protein